MAMDSTNFKLVAMECTNGNIYYKLQISRNGGYKQQWILETSNQWQWSVQMAIDSRHFKLVTMQCTNGNRYYKL